MRWGRAAGGRRRRRGRSPPGGCGPVRSSRRVVALEAAGFDPTAPTAWLTEGLLPYLPPDSQDALLRAIDERSTPGSQWAIEDFTNIGQQMSDPAFRRIAANIGVDMSALIYTDERPDPAAWLRERGWTTDVEMALDVAKSYGRDLDTLTQRLNGQSSLVVARRP